MDHLGSIYIYIALLVITVIMFIVTIMNSVYFADIYNDGSENLSKSQSQQLIVLNIVTCFLLFISIILIIYMCMVPSVTDIKKNELDLVVDKKQSEFDERLDEFEDIKDEVEKKKQLRKQLSKIVSLVDSSRDQVELENEFLKKEVIRLMSDLEDINGDYGDLYDHHGDLFKTNRELKERLEQAGRDKTSIIMEGESDYKESLFGKDYKSSVVPIPILFPDEDSLDEILDEIPKSSIITDENEEKSYDYGLNIQPIKSSRYKSYDYEKSNHQKLEEGTFFSPKQQIKLPVENSKGKSNYVSFLDQMNR